MIVSTFQMCVLLAFNKKDTLTFGELLTVTGIHGVQSYFYYPGYDDISGVRRYIRGTRLYPVYEVISGVRGYIRGTRLYLGYEVISGVRGYIRGTRLCLENANIHRGVRMCVELLTFSLRERFAFFSAFLFIPFFLYTNPTTTAVTDVTNFFASHFTMMSISSLYCCDVTNPFTISLTFSPNVQYP